MFELCKDCIWWQPHLLKEMNHSHCKLNLYNILLSDGSNVKCKDFDPIPGKWRTCPWRTKINTCINPDYYHPPSPIMYLCSMLGCLSQLTVDEWKYYTVKFVSYSRREKV